MARPDINTGSYPVQRRAKIAGCGFNLPDISNPFFREPELKLYRRVTPQDADCRYLKYPGISSIVTGAAGAAIRNDTDAGSPCCPRAFTARPSAYTPQRRRPGCADQPLTAVAAATVRRSMKLTPFTTFGVSQRASTDTPRCLR